MRLRIVAPIVPLGLALVMASCGSTAGSSPATGGGSSGTDNGSGSQPTAKVSFFDRLTASGGPRHLILEGVPRGAGCRARAFLSGSGTDVTGDDLLANPAVDSANTLSWDGALIQLPSSDGPSASQPSEVRVQFRATCTLQGQTGVVRLTVTASP